MTDDAAALGSLALEVAREAAALVRSARTSPVRVAATKSSATDVVTEVDRASEALIRSRLLAARPGDGFLGEEGGDDDSATGVRWIVDPIDGTVNFLYDFVQYAVSIAAESGGEVVAGAVVNVPTGAEHTATLGGGAFRDGQPMTVRPAAAREHQLVLTGFHYTRALRVRQAEAVGRLLGQVRDIRRAGSSALDLCLVAAGSADAYVEEGVHPWDHAAAGLIAREAGARTEVTTGMGGLDLMICAPAEAFEDFRALVDACGFLGRGTGE